MASQNFVGFQRGQYFYDYGSPDDQNTDSYINGSFGENIKGFYTTKNYDGRFGDTLVGTNNNDIMILDDNSLSPEGPHFVNMKTFFGGGGSDVISLGSLNISYGPATIHGDSGSDRLYGNDGGDHLLGGTGNDIVKGYAGADTLEGNDGNDVLDGGLGADKFFGGSGADFVFYDTASSGVQVDLSGRSANGLEAAGDYFSSIEGILGSNFSDVITGNSRANVLVGSAGNDKLNGGLGVDTLYGGAGRDSFVFDKSLSSSNRDRIADFSPINDTIKLDNAVFKHIKPGTLKAKAFKDITNADVDSSDRLLYDHVTGSLYYDSDGSGGNARVKFATIVNDPNNVTHSDFFII